MDFSIETGDLQKAIKLLSVTAKVNVLDSTGMVLITADEDGLITFLSNNNLTALSFASDKAEVRVPGTAVIEYGKIKSFIASFHKWNDKYGVKDFHFDLTDKFLNVSVVNTYENGKVSKGNLKLRVYDSSSIRQPKEFGKPNFVLNANIFRTATNKVLYAINPSDTRAFLQGMNVVFAKDEICFVGTDGQRLSEYKVKNISDLSDGMFLLRYDFIMGLRRVVEAESHVAFEFDDNMVKASFENVVYWGRTIIGKDFPDYKPILESFENSVVLDKEVLMSTLLPFADVLNPDDNYRLTFELDKGEMVLKCDVAEFTYDGEVDFPGQFVIDINGQYMIQTIEVIKDDKIKIRFSDDDGVLIFDSGNFEDQKALITPIRRR
jgi:DNA polymerase III sliding clamp (beta) subunit (PCNA family)